MRIVLQKSQMARLGVSNDSIIKEPDNRANLTESKKNIRIGVL